MPNAVMWFRRDLRLADNPALSAALAAGSVAPLFVLDPALFDASGSPRRAFLIDALGRLDESLDGRLVVRRGRPEDIVPRLAAELEASQVFCAEDYSPYGRRRDQKVTSELVAAGRHLVGIGSPFAVTPGSIVRSDGSPYRVFSAFRRVWETNGWETPTDAPSSGSYLDGVDHQGVPPKEDPGAEVLPAGEKAALDRFELFLGERVNGYADGRNLPAHDGTSRMSVYLKYGNIHPRQMLARLGRGKGPETFRNELCWRDFYADVLFRNPESTGLALQQQMRAMRLDEDKTADERFAAWQEGRTGYPLVDAGMRQLKEQAWMHNRVRMVVASFLVKDLHIDWTRGAAYFMEKLQDGDVASNVHGWQWVAGTGTDAAPYFRVFNPVTQSQKFDPDGDYIRQFVPELRELSSNFVHEPWLAKDGAPSDYPARIVDHGEERAEALRRYAELKT